MRSICNVRRVHGLRGEALETFFIDYASSSALPRHPNACSTHLCCPESSCRRARMLAPATHPSRLGARIQRESPIPLYPSRKASVGRIVDASSSHRPRARARSAQSSSRPPGLLLRPRFPLRPPRPPLPGSPFAGIGRTNAKSTVSVWSKSLTPLVAAMAARASFSVGNSTSA